MTSVDQTDVPFSRRAVLMTTLSSGFALAVQPVSAATISTNAEGLDAREVKIPTNSGELPGYLARPAKRTKLPTVIVVHEIFGVHEHIKDVCRRLAKAGFLAIAPELYARQGDVSKLADFGDIRKVVAAVPDIQVLNDLDATWAWAKEKGPADPGRLAVTGFCWGGRIVWLYAAHSSSLKCGVAWYGRLASEKDELHPKQPIDVAVELKAPVLGLYGRQDGGIPIETVEDMRARLAKAKAGSASRQSEIKVYSDAGHGFFADYRPSYRKPDAEDGWKQMLDWFKKHGVR